MLEQKKMKIDHVIFWPSLILIAIICGLIIREPKAANDISNKALSWPTDKLGWAFEWYFYMQTPPFGAEPFSVEASRWAISYGMYHWGLIPTAMYIHQQGALDIGMIMDKFGTARAIVEIWGTLPLSVVYASLSHYLGKLLPIQQSNRSFHSR